MTVEEYFAYVRDYHRRLWDAIVLARYGWAEQVDEEEVDELFDDEDLWTIHTEPLVPARWERSLA